MNRESCDRYRTYASLRLDDQLSRFEQALLDRHLETCAACQVFAADIAEQAHLLRASELVQPALSFNPKKPGRAHPARVVGAALALAAAAAVVLPFVTSVGPAGQGSNAEASSTPLLQAYLATPTASASLQVPRVRLVPASMLDGPVRGSHGISSSGEPTID